MNKTIFFIMLFACFCIAQDKRNPTHYFKNKWYYCIESYIEPVVEKLPKCSTPNGRCADYDSKGNKIHERDSEGAERWYDFDDKGNKIHERDSEGAEWRYEYFTTSGKKLNSTYDYEEGNPNHVKPVGTILRCKVEDK